MPGDKPEQNSPRRRPPATTPEARENQMIALAVDLAERQLLEGTASSQVITHYLKLGSTKERIEKEILEKQKNGAGLGVSGILQQFAPSAGGAGRKDRSNGRYL